MAAMRIYAVPSSATDDKPKAMFAGWPLFRFSIALLALAYAAAAPAAASIACTPAAGEGCAVPSEGKCSDNGMAQECALACLPLCGAVVPQMPDETSSRFGRLPPQAAIATPLPLRHVGPEPPPPRMG